MGHSIAAKYAARPAARFVHPSSRARERRLGLVPTSSFSAVAARQTELRGSEAGPVRPPAGGLARTARRPDRASRTAGFGPRSRCTGLVLHDPVRVGVPAPRRRRGTPEDRDRHVGRRHRRQVSRPGDPNSSSAVAAANATVGPGPCPRARPSAARPPRRPPCARSARRPAWTSGSPGRSRTSSTGSSSPAPGSTRRCTTS